MKWGELRKQLAEFDALPDDLTTRINSPLSVPPPIPKFCQTCHCQCGNFILNWDDIRISLKHHQDEDEYKLPSYCAKHDPCNDEEEDED